MRSKDDIALSAMSAGWMNEFVEVVLGSAIIIPIAVGYLGIDNVIELTKSGGLGLGFRTLPYLFYQWGDMLGAISGVMWFGLLFFAGITSSLAMGTPWMSFLMDEFNWKRESAAWSFGIILFVLGMPTILFFNYGVFDEYDYWSGTVSLVVFAMVEAILFAWVFGMDKGMHEINSGSDIQVPNIYRFIIKYITPTFILLVFLSSLVTPKDGNWDEALSGNWVLDDSSIIRKISNAGLKEQIAAATDAATKANLEDTLLFVNGSRLLLLLVFLAITFLVYVAYNKRLKEGKI
jgi:SNF family Na+-dependent transporter